MLDPPFYIAAGLLVWGGLVKLRRPGPTIEALVALWPAVPATPALVRAFGLVEAATGTLCLLAPRPPLALALAVLYLAFTGFLASLVSSGAPVSSCGCLGERESPPSVLHVVFNLLAATAGLLAAVTGVPSVLTVMGGSPLFGVPFALALVAAGYLVYLAEAYLPGLFFSYRRPART